MSPSAFMSPVARARAGVGQGPLDEPGHLPPATEPFGRQAPVAGELALTVDGPGQVPDLVHHDRVGERVGRDLLRLAAPQAIVPYGTPQPYSVRTQQIDLTA